MMFMNTARSLTSSRRRSRSRLAASGESSPMSDSQTPVAISRMNEAPVAAATASAQRASQRKSTPNGTSIGRHSVTILAIAAALSRPARSSYGRSFSLQKRTASNPASSRMSTSRRTSDTAPLSPADAS